MPDAWMTDLDLQPLMDHLAAIFPVSGPRFCLEPLDGAIQGYPDLHGGLFEDHDGDLRLALILVCFDKANEEGVQLIEDVKIQECVLVLEEHVDHPHLAAYLDGWAQALLHIFAHGDPGYIGKMKPQELICPEVLNLKAPRTAEEFTHALLGSRQRLGHALPMLTSWPPSRP